MGAQQAEGYEHPHSVEVVDVETGQVRFIKSGAHIKFVQGEISSEADQEQYNSQ